MMQSEIDVHMLLVYINTYIISIYNLSKRQSVPIYVLACIVILFILNTHTHTKIAPLFCKKLPFLFWSTERQSTRNCQVAMNYSLTRYIQCIFFEPTIIFLIPSFVSMKHYSHIFFCSNTQCNGTCSIIVVRL